MDETNQEENNGDELGQKKRLEVNFNNEDWRHNLPKVLFGMPGHPVNRVSDNRERYFFEQIDDDGFRLQIQSKRAELVPKGPFQSGE